LAKAIGFCNSNSASVARPLAPKMAQPVAGLLSIAWLIGKLGCA